MSPEHFTRAFILIQSDLMKLFEYIEPSDENLNSYSYRIHALLMRTCIEVEAKFKAILKENIFNPVDRNGDARTENNWNINDYKKVDKTHHLSSYKVHIPIWNGNSSVFIPFYEWNRNSSLRWYQAYNKSKHNRMEQFKEANFRNLLNAVTGLFVLLSSQFRTESFSPGESPICAEGNSFYPYEPGLGGFFHVEFPTDWEDSEKYDFDWSVLRNESDRFQKINFDQIT